MFYVYYFYTEDFNPGLQVINPVLTHVWEYFFFLPFNFETITLNSQSLHISADFSSFLFWVCFCLCKKIPYKTPHPPLEAFVLCFIFLFTIVTQSLYPRDAASCQHIIDTSIFKWILTSNMLPQVGVSPCGIFNIIDLIRIPNVSKLHLKFFQKTR